MQVRVAWQRIEQRAQRVSARMVEGYAELLKRRRVG